jgi:hypothetical protein
MNCKLQSNIYYYWTKQLERGLLKINYVSKQGGKLSTYECNKKFHDLVVKQMYQTYHGNAGFTFDFSDGKNCKLLKEDEKVEE